MWPLGDFLGKTIGYWDPFKLGEDGDFWGLGNEATIGYLRHAEIKHGRVAMAGFLGFCVQSTPIVAGEHLIQPYRGYVRRERIGACFCKTFVARRFPECRRKSNGTSELMMRDLIFDNDSARSIPFIGKLQIITFVGMLESYGEGAGSPEGYVRYRAGILQSKESYAQVHYTKGGLPGYYPPIKGKGLGQIVLNLYDRAPPASLDVLSPR